MREGAVWSEAKLLIVDDQQPNIRMLRRILTHAGYHDIASVNDGQAALDRVAAVEPDLILLDLHMPGMDGSEVLSRLQRLLQADACLPILVLTGDSSPETTRAALAAGAMDFMTKPFDPQEVLLRVGNLLRTRSLHLDMETRVRERTLWLQAAHHEILERLARAGEFRDDVTGRHASRVGESAASIASALGLAADRIELIRRAAPLHDVGKIAIPDSVLLKAGKLTEEEWVVMKQHTTFGSVILQSSSVELIQLAAEIALCHHEKWDGSGYPHGMEGESIPLAARIVAVADVFDALTHDRPYRTAWTDAEAVAELERGVGTHFDPRVVAAFTESTSKFRVPDDRHDPVRAEVAAAA